MQEAGRRARGTLWVDALVADARFALRQFVRRPVITLTMTVVLSAGMITDRERAILSRLAEELQLSQEEVTYMEKELVAAN